MQFANAGRVRHIQHDQRRISPDNHRTAATNSVSTDYVYQQFGGAVEPYAGLGVGIAGLWGSATGAGIDASDATADLSWSAMVGVNFALNSRVDLNIGLKYQNYGDLDMKDDTHGHISTEVDATELYIGAAYKFGIGM